MHPLACSLQAFSLRLREGFEIPLRPPSENRLFGRYSFAVMPLCVARFSSTDTFDTGDLKPLDPSASHGSKAPYAERLLLAVCSLSLDRTAAGDAGKEN